MSESTSSPSNVHPISPSSSLSTDSAPRSEPTSDEQPVLGFNELLREYTHLQPHPRIPIQLRSPTSSTTPTYHAESVTGSDFRLRTGRANSRSTHSALSSLSTFTRPPTSSIPPDGSTVWTHPFITPYLPSSTPSNDSTLPEDEDELEDDYSPSESASRASTALTVEIRDFRSFDNESRDLNPDGYSSEPTSAIPIRVAGDNQLETPQTEDDLDSLSSHNQRPESSTDIIHRSSSQEQSDFNSIQLKSQVIPVASTSLSFISDDDTGVSISIAGPSSINSRIDTVGIPTSSESTSTLMNVFLNRSRNPVPSRTISDSSYSTTIRTPSSSLSLISYQLPDTPSVADVHREESDREMFPDQAQHTRSVSSTTSTSTAVLTQPMLISSSFRNTAFVERNLSSNSSAHTTDSSLPNPHSLLAVTPLTNPHSFAALSPLTNPHSLPATSPLMNPYSSVATPETGLRFPMARDRFMSVSLAQNGHSRLVDDVDDLDTPEIPPSEAILYEPSQRIFEPIHDDEDETNDQDSIQHPTNHRMQPNSKTNDSRHSTIESYRPGGQTPQYLSSRTSKGIPTLSNRSQAPGNLQPIASGVQSLEQRPEAYPSGEASDVPHLQSESERFVPGPVTASRPEAITISIQRPLEPLQLRRQGTHVELSSMFEDEHSSHNISTLTSHSQEMLRTQAYPSAAGLHLLPSEPLSALDIPQFSHSGSDNLLRENDSPQTQTQFQTEAGQAVDPEAEQVYAEATASRTRFFPSLGYLDEALSFIAAERARLTAARTTTSNLTADGEASGSKEQLGGESEGENDGLHKEEGEDAIGGERGSESKRKRRRRRPPKQPGQPAPLESSPIRDRIAGSSKRRRSKSATRPLSSSASILSLGSSKSGTMTPGRRKDRYKGKEFLIPPPPPSLSGPRSIFADSDLDDGGRTPTNVPVPGLIRMSALLGINPTGVKGKRIGRREREKLKFDGSKARNHKSSGDPDSFDDLIDIGVDYDPNTDNPDGGEAENGEVPGENDSISNMSLLQPPRRLRGKTKSGETPLGLVTKDPLGTNSVPTSINFGADKIRKPIDNAGDEDVFTLEQKDVANGSAEKEKEKKKRTRPKPSKLFANSRSYPTLDVDAGVADGGQLESKESATDDRMDKSDENSGKNQAESTSSNSKQSRLLALAQSLQKSFPEQRDELMRVIKSIEKHRAALSPQQAFVSPDTAGSSEPNLRKSMPIPVPANEKKERKRHARTSSESAITTGSGPLESPNIQHPITDVEEEKEMEEDIDPRGRPPKKKDPLIHVFIDHSNILIGLLSHLKRATPYRKGIYIARRKPLPAVVTTTITTHTVAALEKASTSRLPADRSSSSARDYLIPLPSFATLPRSLPRTSILSSRSKTDGAHSSEEFERKNATNSDGYSGSGIEGGHGSGSGGNGVSALTWQKERKPSKHLWHAALILILERGRPITRRVVAASSPLYQPMETIKKFGYDLRVFIRVPDFGDGMDREHNAEKGKATSVGTTVSHPKRMLSSSESGSGGNASGAGAGTSNNNLHPYYTKSNLGTSPGKIKYREQGVDELLQLKLHQAIAASDDVPDGSTIILATGDGNMGQFNEEGFLGPIRTALRRGWKVELYAWEGGLSRAWKREFGEDTEWGKRGRFRIIAMEPFASWLVEASEWA